MVEILSSSLLGVKLTPEGEKDEYIDGLFVMVIIPKIFGTKNEIVKNMETLKEYIESSKTAAGSKGIFMPGELEFITKAERMESGIEVTSEIWKQIVNLAKLLDVNL